MIKLQQGELFAVTEGRAVTAHSGTVWVTERDNPLDVFLDAGERFTFSRAGLVVVEAFSDAIVSFDL